MFNSVQGIFTQTSTQRESKKIYSQDRKEGQCGFCEFSSTTQCLFTDFVAQVKTSHQKWLRNKNNEPLLVPSKVTDSPQFPPSSWLFTCENVTYVLSNYETTVVRDLIPEKNITAIFRRTTAAGCHY